MKGFLVCEWAGSCVGGVLSRVFFPHEPGLTFLLYGAAGGMVGGLIALACWFAWKMLS
jgi:hypothetical protein